MAIFEYTPVNRNLRKADSLRLVGNPTTPREEQLDVKSALHRLVNKGMDAVSRREATTAEVTTLLARADPENLPVELVSRLLDPEHYKAPVIQSGTGLAMHAPRQEGTPNFAVLSEIVEDVDELVTQGRMGAHVFKSLGGTAELITHDALQYETFVNPDGQLAVQAHETFGFIDGSGQFQPVSPPGAHVLVSE